MGSTVRELLTELAQIEDAIRRTPRSSPGAEPFEYDVNPELLQLAERERAVLDALHRLSGTSPSVTVAAAS